MAGDLDQSLRLVEGWPVDHAAVAVVGDDGMLASCGPVDRRFPVASVTKLLTALTVLVAAEEGTVALDEPAGPPGATVAHLLAHASGLSSSEPGRVLAPPATRRIYSGAGFEALADHLAARSGMAFVEYLAEAVIEPLELDATSLDGSPAADITSTATDLARLAAELLNPRLIDPATLARATTVAFPGLAGVLPGYGRQEPNDWGLGFELRAHKRPHWTGGRNHPATFGHFGQTGTFLWVDPAARLALVVLTDRAFGPWAIDRWPVLGDAVLEAA